jgi:hypothetical protein
MKNFNLNPFRGFTEIFKDTNDFNEKSIVGFIAFGVMVAFAMADLITGYVGEDLVINEIIYDSFKWIVISVFAIGGGEKIFKKE